MENENQNLSPEPTQEKPVQKEKKGTDGKKIAIIVLAVALCASLLLTLTLLVLSGAGLIAFNFLAPTQQAPTKEPTTETTLPADLKSYSAGEQELKAAADQVVATAGNSTLTNGELQVYYWMGIYDFVSQNSYYLSYMGVDFSKPLDEQVCNPETNQTWQEAMLEYALQTWHQYAALNQHADAQGFVMNAEGQAYLEGIDENIQKTLENFNYSSIEEMLKTEMGPGATEFGYRNFMKTGYSAVNYVSSYRKALTMTEEELEKYFADNSEAMASSGITKESGDLVDVRHILICPQGGEENEDGGKTYSEEEWEACRQKAQQILDQWKNGEATEDSFGKLAQEHSEDSGSKSLGGLYEGVSEGYMITEFNDWIFDESRVYADTDLVKTSYGYHIMFFVDRAPMWIYACTNQYKNEQIDKLVQQVKEDYPLQTDYTSILLGQADMG